jgi:3-deoxy-D-manno-octulosonate 8-phosphate phosphatase KdsC-like HAD superfamily phosphatase
MGIAVIIVTADEWGGTKWWAQRVGAALVPGIRDKKAWAINEGLKASETLVIGDDAWDVELLQWARWKFCPNDSDSSVYRVPGIEILGFNGGQAVVAEVLNILREQGLK